MDDISKDDCIKLSNKIREDIYKPANTFKTTIFLCGADIYQKDKIRYKIAEKMKQNWHFSYTYDIIYPEDIFDELLYSSKKRDLLSLEGLLADSVDAIVLIPESPGSFAELGAFANDEKLRKKIICLVDKKYKKDKSFINQGPLKLVKKENPHGVIFIDPNNISAEMGKLLTSLRKMKNTSLKMSNVISLLQIDNFLLPSIYLLEPISKLTLIKLVEVATQDDLNSFQVTTTALTSLTKKRYVELTNTGYKLTNLGIENFLKLRTNSKKNIRENKTVEIDNLRLEILNLKNRNKKLRI
jgi:L-fucose mutarotase/ribose pyranase (RbsD/FucU family)